METCMQSFKPNAWHVGVNDHCVPPLVSTTQSSVLASGYDFYIVFPIMCMVTWRSNLICLGGHWFYNLVNTQRVEASWMPIVYSSFKKLEKAVGNTCGLQ